MTDADFLKILSLSKLCPKPRTWNWCCEVEKQQKASGKDGCGAIEHESADLIR